MNGRKTMFNYEQLLKIKPEHLKALIDEFIKGFNAVAKDPGNESLEDEYLEKFDELVEKLGYDKSKTFDSLALIPSFLNEVKNEDIQYPEDWDSELLKKCEDYRNACEMVRDIFKDDAEVLKNAEANLERFKNM